jgi:hypothetical protein
MSKALSVFGASHDDRLKLVVSKVDHLASHSSFSAHSFCTLGCFGF